MTAGPTRVPQQQGQARTRAANVRTALALLSVAVVFFFGVLVAKYVGDTSTGMTVLGVAVLLFLLIAIGRNLRGR
ncbi:MAG: cytochrome oxidase small assembly protein [Burkholderiales bacterium]